ncbi:putative F-box protein At5g38270 [Curcuma longa]|uniref:putative F-box protein At5g38270 n=1 Tax=Curcuma longa TaxID=136217 RepID=UPI003D9EA0FF
MRYAGSNIGWVAIVDLDFNISLLNPLTGAQIHLPSLLYLFPFESLPNCGGYIFHDKKVGMSYFHEYNICRDYHIEKVIFSSNPTLNNYMAMVICNGFPTAYTKAGASKWINLDFSPCDIIYYDGLFYALRGYSKIVAIDLSGDDPIKRVIIGDNIEFSDSFLSLFGEYHQHYLAFSSTGELFLILRCAQHIFLDPADDDPIKYETLRFKIFKYNCENDSCWDEVRCLGNKSIFIGMNNAYLLSVEDEDFTGLKANCIYFADTWEGSRCNVVIGRPNLDAGFFDLEQEKFNRCCLPYEMLLPPPIWFMPSMERHE